MNIINIEQLKEYIGKEVKIEFEYSKRLNIYFYGMILSINDGLIFASSYANYKHFIEIKDVYSIELQ